MGKLQKKLKDMKVKKKLIFLSASLLALGVIQGLLSIVSLNMMNLQAGSVTRNWMPAVILIEELDGLTADYRIKQYNHVVAQTEEEKDEFETVMAGIEKQISEKMTSYSQTLQDDRDSSLYKQADQFWKDYMGYADQVKAYSDAGQTAEAGALLIGDARVSYNEFTASLDELKAYNTEGANNASDMINNTFIFVVCVSVAIILFIIIVAVVVSAMITKIIVRPLEEIRHVMKRVVGEGNLGVKVEHESKDEFGVLAYEVNEFIDGLTMIIKDQKVIMGNMAEGNFDVISSIPQLYIGDFEPIIVAMRGIKLKLGNALSNIADNADQLNHASEQMAQEAQALSEGAAEQASTVEEIMATVVEVEEKSVISAKQASNVNNQAKEAKTQAEISNEQMNQMIKEMDAINQTSQQIASIINDIEEIASQTNLLSLNASIEAARAGEAGKGFAVVADEIGKLALQCSESANNTRRLIETAISEAAQGNSIARKTADALLVVTENIDEIALLAEEVKQNCEEQSLSMKQIDEGVENISKVVEANSAAAEESTASSEELEASASSLNEQLAEFVFSK